MMTRKMAGLLFCGLVAGCSQTTETGSQQPGTLPPARQEAKGATQRAMTQEQRCEEQIRKAMQTRQNAAMAGSILSAVGGLGGFAGQGGMIAGQAAAIGGSLIQTQAQSQSQAGLMTECR